MLNSNLASFLFGWSARRHLLQTRLAWRRTEVLWRKSPLARHDLDEIADEFVQGMLATRGRSLAPAIREALKATVTELLVWEGIGALEVDWPVIRSDALAAFNFRQMLARRRIWAGDFAGTLAIFRRVLDRALGEVIDTLSAVALAPTDLGIAQFELSLIELLDHPAAVVERQVFAAYDAGSLSRELFSQVRKVVERNLLSASGLPPTDDIRDKLKRVVTPARCKDKAPRELSDTYLAGLPFHRLMDMPIPFQVPEESRFEHCHIVGGTGHGKTQLMQRMIHADLVAATKEKRSVVVIDSQGDLINKLMRLKLFDPEAPDSLADRLVVIDPSDVEFPAALNLFDPHLERVQDYRPVDRERILNGVIELYETFFGSMLGAELTQKQGVIFRYLARLMVSIPGASIYTLMQLMEDGKHFKPYMDALDGSARYFFQTEFFHPSFSATKKQILKRLWGVLSTPAFERMFAQKANKLDLFEAIDEGKIILVSTAKDLLKADGSALFGRFFIAMLAQAALERSTQAEAERTPTFVYVDEAQEYFDDAIETILNQARKYRVGLTLAHQTLDQLTPRLRSALHANTSFKCVGGLSNKDARAFADEMRTTADFIESMRRGQDRTDFAVWLKHQTPHAIRLSVPIGFLERQPILAEEALAAVIDQNRARYCGTETDMLGFDIVETDEPPPTATRAERPQSPLEIQTEPAAPEPEAVRTRPALPVREALEAVEVREAGKGGPQHRYVQHLIKGLGEERGFRVVIEEAVEGGHVDVALHAETVSIACEISVTSKAEYEAQNIAKCLRANFTRVWAIAASAKRLRQIEQVAKQRLAAEDLERVEFLVVEDVIAALEGLVAPTPDENTVKGYRVKVSHKSVFGAEADERRSTITRIVSRSLRDPPS
jgi:Helicase HerA, central domain